MLKYVTVEVWITGSMSSTQAWKTKLLNSNSAGLTTHTVVVEKALPSLCLGSFLCENYLFSKGIMMFTYAVLQKY